MALVLTRLTSEWIVIRDRETGKSLRVGINRVKGAHTVSLMFDDLPNHYEIMRQEVMDRPDEGKRADE